jgi:DNA-binding NarL/FixJ family response regulator
MMEFVLEPSMPLARPDIIRVILADDHLVVRAGLKALLGTSKDIEVVGEATNGREAVALVERVAPHIAVLDLDMPQMDGLAATKELVARGSATRVLILTMHTEDEYLVTLLEAGAAGYLVKNAADRELADAVRAVAAGGLYVQPAASLTLARAVARRAEHADEREKYQQLSERERDVLVLVASGHSASEIGEKLFISPKTVETYKQRITEKLELSHRPDYVQFCLRLGLLQANRES